MIAKDIDLMFDCNDTPKLLIILQNETNLKAKISDLRRLTAEGKQLTVDIKQYRSARSKEANSYMWKLVSDIAEHPSIKSSKEEVYIEMLKKYGQREPELLSVIAEAADMVYRATDNHCYEVGESELNGKMFKHLAILIGSSKYDTKQMSILIDGVVNDAQELGIETKTPDELEKIKSLWGQDNGRTQNGKQKNS